MSVVSIIEIPVSDFGRAKQFYERVLGTSLENVEMGEALMALFPADEGSVNVALVKADGYQPSAEGALIYLSAGEDLQVVLDRIEEAGGRILLQKTEISPEMGFFAQFSDSEGNRMGLHSPQ